MDIKTLREIVKEYFLQTYEDCGRNKTHTAKVLGIGIRTVQRKLAAYAAEERQQQEAKVDE